MDSLRAGFGLLRAADIEPDVLLLTGDLAEAGDAACYREVAELIASAAPDATAVYIPGNHDDRAAFRRQLTGGPGGAQPLKQTRWRSGLRIVALDSTVPGEAYGALDARTLDYLRSELATAAPDGTVVMLHHPPIPSPVEPIARMGLRNADDLNDALAGSDVRIILCGHYHHEASGSVAGVPVWVSPAIATRTDVTSTRELRMIPGSACSRIDLFDRQHVVSVIPIATA